MGNAASSLPLYAQPNFPRVINQRFVDHKRMVSLILDDQFFLPSDSQGSPLSEIRDADLDTVVFKVQRPSPNQKKLLLMDGNGVPAVALECFTVESQLAIYEATNPLTSVSKHSNMPAPLLARFETCFRPMRNRRLVVDLPDGRGGNVRIHCRGRWEEQEAWLYIDRATFKGKAPDIEYIVRVQPLKLTSEEKKKRKAQGIKRVPYKVTIAPGVDVAFVVLVCAAMDQEVAKKGEIFQATEEELARIAERPLHGELQRLQNDSLRVGFGGCDQIHSPVCIHLV